MIDRLRDKRMFDTGYLTAVQDMEQLIANANSNHSGGDAPWSYNFEISDQLIILKDEIEKG